ncbi:hypothetical protein XENTR_v10014662 [Xenopus tropicalis]|uniref:Mast cell carboxypeptidase A n=1 Tax=Xenopus tropicalis TaxID=8364 RepID=A0A8J0SEJ5_XENTR|nr:mast cell carboxypeptidase A [Xenopus tropicalis]KAE8604295.1 hypothetical protein XENTR_v10014662 [Xenopus tropicalis]|eukprot:XP_012818774.2 PREDICTED: mast cell carboxypeptidase A-like [Xenopus tropicalis]
MKIVILFVVIVASLAAPFIRRFDNEKALRVFPQNEEDVQFIKHLARVMQLNFWKPHSSSYVIPKAFVDFHANAEDSHIITGLLEEKGIKHRILFQNLQEAIENQLSKAGNPKDERFPSPRYRTWLEISTWAYRVSVKYPNLVSVVQAGNTYEGQTILVLKVGSQSAHKKGIVLECGVHAREWISPAFCQWFVNEAIRSYGKDKAMTKLLNSVTFHVVPVFNVDGYIWTWTHDRMWRKNRYQDANNKCVGVDLNRNFNASWGTGFSNDEPCSEIYAGSGPESENETKAVASYIRDNISSLKAYISFHAYGQMLMYPYGYKSEKPPNSKKLDKIAVSALKALSTLYGTSYTHGPIATTIYPVSGSSIDWAYDEGMKYSFAFELRDEGQYGFLLPENQIKKTCMETMLAVKAIAKSVVTRDI